VRFLVDEMYGPDLLTHLRTAGFDADHVQDLGLRGAQDRDVLARAAEDDSIVVTENAADFIPLLDARTAAGLPTPPVIIALRRTLPTPAGAMHHALADKLTPWAKDHPSPYRHVHYLA
jgi:predicted nuclease of predicted toxin-antitoxin system